MVPILNVLIGYPFVLIVLLPGTEFAGAYFTGIYLIPLTSTDFWTLSVIGTNEFPLTLITVSATVFSVTLTGLLRKTGL